MKFSLCNTLFCLVLAWSFFLAPNAVSAQQKSLESPVSLSVSNEPVSLALDKLSRNCGITFSYNPDQIIALKQVTVDYTNKPLREVLSAILPPEQFGYKLSGNNVVLYKLKPDLPVIKPVANELLPGREVQDSAAVPDTVFITRTETRMDTLVLTDTIMKYDTVYIMRTVTRDKPITGDDIFSHQTNLKEGQKNSFTYEGGFSITWLVSDAIFSAEPLYNDKLEAWRTAFSPDLLSGSLNLDFRISYARFSLESGISLTGFNQKFKYNYDVKTGGYFLQDTLDSYYTLPPESDTLWYYVLDSTYLPVDLKQFRYKTGIQHRFIEIPLAIQYNYPVGRMLVYGKAGVIASVHAGSKGLYILPEEDGVGEITDLEVRPVIFSWVLGAGSLIPINQHVTFNIGAIYRRQLQGFYPDFPIDQRFGAFGINAGIIYKF